MYKEEKQLRNIGFAFTLRCTLLLHGAIPDAECVLHETNRDTYAN